MDSEPSAPLSTPAASLNSSPSASTAPRLALHHVPIITSTILQTQVMPFLDVYRDGIVDLGILDNTPMDVQRMITSLQGSFPKASFVFVFLNPLRCHPLLQEPIPDLPPNNLLQQTPESQKDVQSF